MIRSRLTREINGISKARSSAHYLILFVLLERGIWRQESMQQREAWELDLYCMYVATQMILRVTSNQHSQCQQLLTEQLQLYNVPKQVQEWLSKFRVSLSYTTANLKHFNTIDLKLLEG
jgi:vacuolar-type H+-ATPase catalytic subunit A/Vma1